MPTEQQLHEVIAASIPAELRPCDYTVFVGVFGRFTVAVVSERDSGWSEREFDAYAPDVIEQVRAWCKGLRAQG